VNPSPPIASDPPREPVRTRPPFVGAISGKGGVGKTNLIANLAVAASGLGARVLLVDGDLGLANLDVLLGLVPTRCVSEVLTGQVPLDEVLVPGPRGVRLLPAASGRSDLAALDAAGLACLSARLEENAHRFDLVLVDIGAGVGPAALGLAALCDPILLVTNAEPTSLADAYATLKLLRRNPAAGRIELVVNSAADPAEGLRTHAQLARLAKRFLDDELPLHGVLPRDPRLAEAVTEQRTVVEAFPGSPASQGLVAMAARLLRRSTTTPPPANGGWTHGAFD
jgi:flagellar biosynthesis protein FlhG